MAKTAEGKPEKAEKAGKGGKGDKADKAHGEPAEKAEPGPPPEPPRMFVNFQSRIRPELMQAKGIENVNAVPRLRKIVISMGVGAARENKALIDAAAGDLTQIAGQKAAVRRAKKAVSNFKIREDMPIGCVVTLRGYRMWEFLDRLVSVVIPRIKDFRGLRRAGFDGRGNFSMGLPDQTVFPEIDLDKIKHFQGMNIAIVTTAGSDELGLDLLERLGMPFRKPGEKDDTKEGGKR
jgi:large subunit ribosomal protein L5